MASKRAQLWKLLAEKGFTEMPGLSTAWNKVSAGLCVHPLARADTVFIGDDSGSRIVGMDEALRFVGELP